MDLVRSIASRFGRWLSGVFPSRRRNPQHELGQRGEKIAERFLRRSGYKVLYRRYKARGGGEVDLICRHKNTLVFAEVKTRTSTQYGRPYEAVDPEKQRLISKGAIAWLRLLDKPEVLYRFDIVEVLVDQRGRASCEIVADAFTLPNNVYI